MIFGYIDYVITGDSFTKFFRRIMSKKLPVSKMCEKNGKLTLRMTSKLYHVSSTEEATPVLFESEESFRYVYTEV